MKFFKIFFAAALLLPGFTATANTTNAAANASYWAVSNAVAISAPGDVVIIPAGIAHWSNDLVLTGVSIRGNSTNRPTIIDDITNTIAGGSLDYLLTIYAGNSGHNSDAHISDINFQGDGTSPNGYYQGRLLVTTLNNSYANQQPTNARAIFERCSFSNMVDSTLFFSGGTVGLVRACTFSLIHTGVKAYGGYQQSGNDSGDILWSLPAELGSSNAVVVENCVFTNLLNSGSSQAAMDSGYGSHTVFRFNTVLNTFWSNHGNDTLWRGARIAEIYSNTFAASDSFWSNYNPITFRSGSGVVFGNTITGYANIITIENYRANWGNGTNKISGLNQFHADTFFGGADGFSPFDSNGPVALTFTQNGQPGAGIITNTSSNPWTVNAWRGYTARDTNSGLFACIYSNSANYAWHGSDKDHGLQTFTNGAALTFRQVYFQLDQVGAGQCDLIVGTGNNTPSNTVTHSIGNPRHTSEPLYYWGNNLNGSPSSVVGIAAGNVIPGRDVTNAVMPGFVALAYPSSLSDGMTNSGVAGGGTNPPATNSPGYKISTMSPATALANGDLFAVVQTTSTGGNTNRSVTALALKNFLLDTVSGLLWPYSSTTNAPWISANQAIAVSGDYTASGSTSLALVRQPSWTNAVQALVSASSNSVVSSVVGFNSTSGTNSPNAVTLGTSPFNFTNTSPVALECYFSGGVNGAVSKNGTLIYAGAIFTKYLVLQPRAWLSLTWSTNAPTLNTNAW